MQKLDNDVLLATVRAYQETGSQRRAAEMVGLDQPQVCRHLKEAKARGLYREHDGTLEIYEGESMPLPPEGEKAVYFLSCAQNHTLLAEETFRNLMAFVEHDKGKLMVSAIKYNKGALGQRAAAKADTYASRTEELAAEYPRELIPFICDDRINLTQNLVFCGELNIMPTAVSPLSGMANYTYRKSTIVPHPKLALESVATMKGEGVKLMYTTGALTVRNYIKRKEGFKAEHFHSYGALIVEVNSKGNWFVRQLIQGEDGAMYDMDRRAYKGKITTGHRVADIAIEVHADKLDKVAADLTFGHNPDSMFERLRPHSTHVHDILDFSGRSHHTRRDPHETFRSFVNGKWELTQELRTTADVLWNQIARPWCETYVVNANHDRHLIRWLQEVDWRDDPTNAEMILALNLVILQSIRAGRKINMTAVALGMGFDKIETKKIGLPVTFLAEDESHIILPNINGGIEAGLHGDRGANGAKGTIVGIAKVDRPTNMGDKHQVAIVNHCYCHGLIGLLDQGYNHGLGSWTQANTITYVNGTRAIYSIWKGAWHA